ncbi:MAG: hypothetical protein ACXWQO_15600, partial [Bdellovibrionota bacterium]
WGAGIGDLLLTFLRSGIDESKRVPLRSLQLVAIGHYCSGKTAVINALKRFNGRINQTVAHANIPKNTLLRKIRKYDIKPFEFGADAHESEEMVPDETL